MCGGDSLHLFQKSRSFSRQLQLLASTVLSAALARNQAFALKLIEQHNQAAGHYSEMRGEFALILPFVGVDPPQDTEMRR